LAGSLPVALLASLTGIPLSRSCPDAEAVGDAALVVESVPAAYDAGRTAEAWDEATGVGAAEPALAVLGVSCQDSLEPLELKVDAFCPGAGPAAGDAAGEAAGAVVALGCTGVVACGVAVRL